MTQEMNECYDELKRATSEDLLEAAIMFYAANNPESEPWLRLGFALAGLCGWENIAPAWLCDWQRLCSIAEVENETTQ